MSNEIYLLREENKRLRMLLDVLTEKLAHTTSRLSAYADAVNGGKSAVYSDARSGDRIDNAGYSDAKGDVGGINPVYSEADGNYGVNYVFPSVANTNIGVNVFTPSIVTTGIGVNNIVPAVVESGIGVNNVSSHTEESNAPIKPINMPSVENGVRAHMPNCRRSSVRNAAEILMQLYTNPRNSYKVLRHLTGLSEDGMTKHIMALKKRGLIVRTAFQEYTLTDAALQILEHARR